MISLNNGYVYLGGGKLLKRNILIDKGRISRLSSSIFHLGQVIDCSYMWILPGAIDPHVHFRVPGFEEKEDWRSGSMAAVSAGVTSVIDMPNTNPPTVSLELLEEKRKIACRDSLVNFGFHFGLSLDNLDELDRVYNIASLKVYFGSSTGNLLVSDLTYLNKVLSKLGNSVPFLFHAEDEDVLNENKASYSDLEGKMDILKFHNKLRDERCAYSAVSKIIELGKQYPSVKIYFCHVSTKDELILINKAKDYMKVYLEATPHHIFLSHESFPINLSYLAKVNPPLRSLNDSNYMYSSFLSGNIDLIGTDHAPHLVKEKMSASYKEVPSGMPGLESFVPLLLNEVLEGNISLESFVKFTSENAAKIFSISNKAFIYEGFDADLMIVDPSISHKIKKDNIYTKVAWNPFENRVLHAKVMKTIVGGKLIFSFEDGFIESSASCGSEMIFA